MSDLSVPPISLLPLDAADTGRAAAAPPAAAAGARFAWPTPNLPCYPAPQPALAPEACVIEGLNGSTMAGRLMHFSPEAGLAHVQVSASRTTLPLRFSQFRALRLAKPLNPLPFKPTETTPLALTERKAQPYRVELKDGSRLEGRTITHEETASGLFLFEPTDDNGAVRRCFVPRDNYRHVDIGQRLGEALIEQRAATAEQVSAALGEQQRLRNRKLGEILVVRQLISRQELEAAIDEQAHMPMVRIGQALTALGYITEAQLEQALQQQQQDKGVPLGELLVRSGTISQQDLQTALARKMGYPLVDPMQFPAEADALGKLPFGVASRLEALPLMMGGGRLVVALEDPTRRKTIDEVEFTAGCKVIPVLARAGTLRTAVELAYQKTGVATGGTDSKSGAEFQPDDAGKLLATLEQEHSNNVEAAAGDENLGKPIEQSDNSLVRLINSMIHDAQAQGVSDIHIECAPGREKVKIRFRKDGQMQPYIELPPTYRNALIARIKIMCDLDISERRKPQDGKINFGRFMQGQKLELRVATIPTNNNCEDAVLRLLASSKPLPLDKLNLSPHNLERLKFAAERPYGMILCVGPTGSGKTTTLHSVMGFINTPDRKIWTAEDPIEITQSGLRQVQVNPKIDWTFARALRAFLRADPDVIMVGEIRDKETASIAIESSLTGHLVMSTLHTNSAAETVTRLLDMGMDPFNFADALLVVLAQRLVRRLCPHCCKPRDALPHEVEELLADHLHAFGDLEGKPTEDAVLADWQRRFGREGRLQAYDAPGCDKCDASGYKGRAGVHELMHMTPAVRRLIQTGGRAEQIQQAALAEGLRTLRQDGIEKVLAGITSIAEVRATTNA
ncbi:MAG: Flp pilus assembly complex ATPase component TadA [Proteobacteria bacterium]|nr:Flp pilus assembly complex ATPase component TadA [Pseudomonadota bacterium]